MNNYSKIIGIKNLKFFKSFYSTNSLNNFEKHIFLKSEHTNTKEKTNFIFPNIISNVKDFMEKEKDLKHNGFRVLVLSPTRDSCLDFQKEFKKLDNTITTNVNIGGTSQKNGLNEWDFDSPEVIFSTPGRLLKFYEQSDYFENLKYIILNEPDKSFEKLSSFFKIVPSFSKKIIISKKEKEEFFESLKQVEKEEEEEEKEEEGEEKEEKVDFFKQDEFVSMKLESDEKVEEIKREGIEKVTIKQVLKDIITISKENLNSKIGIFLPTKYFVDYFYEILKENELYSFHYHGGDSMKQRIFVNSEFNSISNGILITTNQLGYHLNSTKFDLIFTLNENEMKFQNTKKIINFIPSPKISLSNEQVEEEEEEEVDIKLTKKNLKSFKFSYRKYLKYLNEQSIQTPDSNPDSDSNSNEQPIQTPNEQVQKYFKMNL
eukprot:gene5424-9237_t